FKSQALSDWRNDYDNSKACNLIISFTINLVISFVFYLRV
ncbi:hypothetical protein HMPREF0497_2914, partial [Lentilactobacillus buchneri ATCC 11577]